jgi:hypothetical protein
MSEVPAFDPGAVLTEAPATGAGPVPAGAPAGAGASGDTGRERLRRFLDQPFVGFLPWIMLSVVEGPNRVVLASALACALAVLIAVLGTFTAVKAKLLDVTAIAFFAVLTVVAVATGAGTQHWLGIWAGEVSNAAIALITVVSIAVGRPFTLQYARETTEAEYWDTPLFLRINYIISAVWAGVFLVTAVVGYIGDGPLHQPDNVWTNWIVQIALIVLAIKFTDWYPDYATAEASEHDSGEARTGTVSELLRPVAVYLVPAGIVVMLVSGQAWWTGAALIVIGIVVRRRLREM